MGGSTNYKPVRQEARTAAARRRYGELGNGFQNQEQFNGVEASQKAYKAITKDAYTKDISYYDHEHNQVTETVFDEKAYNSARSKVLTDGGLSYDENYDTWSLSNGVDLDSAKEDWNNYSMEREEIAVYEAKEERRKVAPDDLTGTSGQVDYTLSIGDDEEDVANTGGTLLTAKEKDVNVNSTNQSLGIATDG